MRTNSVSDKVVLVPRLIQGSRVAKRDGSLPGRIMPADTQGDVTTLGDMLGNQTIFVKQGQTS